jgi:hypothetical protein
VPMCPIIYRGPFSLDAIKQRRPARPRWATPTTSARAS